MVRIGRPQIGMGQQDWDSMGSQVRAGRLTSKYDEMEIPRPCCFFQQDRPRFERTNSYRGDSVFPDIDHETTTPETGRRQSSVHVRLLVFT